MNPKKNSTAIQDSKEAREVAVLWRMLAKINVGDKVGIITGLQVTIQPPSTFLGLQRSWNGFSRRSIPSFIFPFVAQKTCDATANCESLRSELLSVIPEGLRGLSALRCTYVLDSTFCSELDHAIFMLRKALMERGLLFNLKSRADSSQICSGGGGGGKKDNDPDT